MNMKLQKILCVDLDGTVRQSKSGKDFIKDENDIEAIPGMTELLWKYKDEGYLICGVSNQGGVAFGYKTHAQNMNELTKTAKLFEREVKQISKKINGKENKPYFEQPFITIKCSYYHPEGTVEPYCHKSLIRKPHYGMLVLIELEMFDQGFIVDWDNSLFVGDRPEDKQCAEGAGIKFEWIKDFLNTL